MRGNRPPGGPVTTPDGGEPSVPSACRPPCPARLPRPTRPHRPLREDPGRAGAAVEEFLRYDGPSPVALRRFPVEDLTIGGVTVPAGETVMLGLSSANHDPHRFPHPELLDLDRDTVGQLALGHGIHYCLGAPLARLETEIALTALLERFPRLALDVPYEELRRRPSTRARGLPALPVRY